MRRVRRLILIGFLAFLSCLIGFGATFYQYVERGLPSLAVFEHYRPLQTAYFFDSHGNLIGCQADEYREVLSKETIRTLRVAQIIISTEDERFPTRPYPVDMRAVLRAAYENWKAKKVVEGGSTLEQQAAKQLLPYEEQRERSFMRKIRELLLSVEITKKSDKDSVLAFYLNQIYFGHQQYGIQAAAHWYYGKDASELSIAEAATLAGLIKAPEIFSPLKHRKASEERRTVVLEVAYRNGVITKKEYETALKESFVTSNNFRNACKSEPYVVDYARTILREKYNLFFDKAKINDAWYGLRVHTTIDPEFQRHAQDAVKYTLNDYHLRQGEHAIDANSAALVLDNKTGAIRALIGGKNYTEDQFNVITQGMRQPGSAFKPPVYTAYIQRLVNNGESLEGILDRPIPNRHINCRGATKWQRWIPHNYDPAKNSAAWYRLRDAIKKSINLCVLFVAAPEGRPCSLNPDVVLMARNLGIVSSQLYEMGKSGALHFRLPIALGAADVRPMELARAYMIFANSGVFREEYLVERIEKPDGTIVIPPKPADRVAISPEIAQIMTVALRGVVISGTAQSTFLHVDQEVAGKTGTTNGFHDAWFVGFTPEFTLLSWVGSDDKEVSLGSKETGGKTASPIVAYIVQEYYRTHPKVSFPENQ